MKNKSILAALALLSLPTVSSGQAAPDWLARLELQIVDIVPVSFTQEGLHADVSFTGNAGGPYIVSGIAIGVDHAFFEISGTVRLNVYLTITDRQGDRISANVTGTAVFSTPGHYVIQSGSGIIINAQDPNTGVLHPTNGKYAHLIGDTFEDLGFITAFSFDPPGGSVHVNWYLN